MDWFKNIVNKKEEKKEKQEKSTIYTSQPYFSNAPPPSQNNLKSDEAGSTRGLKLSCSHCAKFDTPFFKSDDEDIEGTQKDLSNLWEKFITSPHEEYSRPSAGGGSTISPSLHECFVQMTRTLQDWHPELAGDPVPNTVGHPSGLVIAATDSLKKAVRDIQRVIQRAEKLIDAGSSLESLGLYSKEDHIQDEGKSETVKAGSATASLNLIQLVAILSRSARNAKIIVHHDISGVLVRLLKLAVTKLKLMLSSKPSFRNQSKSDGLGMPSQFGFSTMNQFSSNMSGNGMHFATDASTGSGIEEGKSESVNAHEVLISYLQDLIIAGFRICCNLVDASLSWRSHVLAIASGAVPAKSEHEKLGLSSACALNLLEHGVLGHLNDAIGLMKSKHPPQTMTAKHEMLVLALECIGSITFHIGPVAQNKVREINVLEVLVEGLGWPSQHDGESSEETSDQTELHREFDIQTLRIMTICVVVDGLRDNVRRLAALYGLEKLCESVLWVAANFTKEHSGLSQEDYPDVNILSMVENVIVAANDTSVMKSCRGVEYRLLRGYHSTEWVQAIDPPMIPSHDLSPQLTQLFDALFVFSLTDVNADGGRFCGVNAASLKSLMEIFNSASGGSNSTAAREYIRLMPEIQIHTLGLAVRLLTHPNKSLSSDSLVILRKLRAWRTLLGAAFFVPASQIEQLENGEVPGVSTSVGKNAAALQKLCAKIGLQLIQYVATQPPEGSYIDTTAECGMFLELLSRHGSKDEQTCFQVAHALRQVLFCHPAATQTALLKLDVTLPVLRILVDHHRSIHESFCESCAESFSDFLLFLRERRDTPAGKVVPFKFTSADHCRTYHYARAAVLSLLDQYFSIQAGSALSEAESDRALVDCLFALVFEITTRQFAITRLCHIIQCSVPGPDHEDPALMRRYLELLPVISSYAGSSSVSFSTLVALLVGLQFVVEKNTKKHQKTLRDLNGFIMVTTVLNIDILDPTPVKMLLPPRIKHPKLLVKKSKPLQLLHEVLFSITAMTAKNSRSKATFREHIGYDQLTALILRTEPSPSPETMMLLFDMLLDGDNLLRNVTEVGEITEFGNIVFDDANDHVAIQHTDVISVIFGILPKCAPELRTDTLVRFTNLVRNYTLNLSHCSMAGLLGILLEMIPDVAAEQYNPQNEKPLEKSKDDLPHGRLQLMLNLLSILGSHSISVRELKIVFSLLREGEDGTRPPYTADVLKALHDMCGRIGPEIFFDFDGRSSALSLPPIENWPPQSPKRGYSFATWLRVESFDDPEGKPAYEPRIFSMVSESLEGTELFFERQSHVITVQVTSKGKTHSANFGNFKFEPRTWHHLVFCHSAGGRVFGGSPEAKLYVDGKLQQKASLKYPAVSSKSATTAPTKLDRCRIGSSCQFKGIPSSSDQQSYTQSYREMPLWGQMGAVYFFDDIWNDSIIAALHAIGPNYIGTFHPADAESQSHYVQDLFDRSLMSSIFLSYNCKSCEGRYSLDNTPLENGKLPYNAKLVGMSPCVTRDVRDTIHCLGGVPVLFPLLPQLDLPVSGKGSEDTVDPILCVRVLEVLSAMLLQSKTNQDEMNRVRGAYIVPHLLMMVDPGNVTPDCLKTLYLLTSSMFSSNRELWTDLLRAVFLDFRLVFRASTLSQVSWAEYLAEIAIADKTFFRETLDGVQQVLDIMRIFLWFDPSSAQDSGYSNNLFGVEEYEKAIKEETKQQKQKREFALREVRMALLDVVDAVCEGIPTQQETLCILNFLSECGDPGQLEDVLLYLVRLMKGEVFLTSPQQSDYVCNNLLESGGPWTFLHLAGNQSEGVRVAALACIITLSDQKPKELVDALQLDDVVGGAALAKKLGLYPLTTRVYQTLLALLLGRNPFPNMDITDDDTEFDTTEIVSRRTYSDFSLNDVAMAGNVGHRRRADAVDDSLRASAHAARIRRIRQYVMMQESGVVGLDFNQSLEMKHPPVACTILQLCQNEETSTSLRLRALQDLLLLLTHSPVNRPRLSKITGWEEFLLGVMIAQKPKELDQKRKKEARSSQYMVTNKTRPQSTLSQLVQAREQDQAISKVQDDMDTTAVHDLVMQVHQMLYLGGMEREPHAWHNLHDALIGIQVFAEDHEDCLLNGDAAIRRILKYQVKGLASTVEKYVNLSMSSDHKHYDAEKQKEQVAADAFYEAKEVLEKRTLKSSDAPPIFGNVIHLLAMLEEYILFVETPSANSETKINVESRLRRGDFGEWMDAEIVHDALQLVKKIGLSLLLNVVPNESSDTSGHSTVQKTVFRLTLAVISADFEDKRRMRLACDMLAELLDFLSHQHVEDFDHFLKESLPYALWKTFIALGVAEEITPSNEELEFVMVPPIAEETHPKEVKHLNENPSTPPSDNLPGIVFDDPQNKDEDGPSEEKEQKHEEPSPLPPHKAETPGRVKAKGNRSVTWRGYMIDRHLPFCESYDLGMPPWVIEILVQFVRRVLRTRRSMLSMIFTDSMGDAVLNDIPSSDEVLSISEDPLIFLEQAAGDVKWRCAIRKALPQACMHLRADDNQSSPAAKALQAQRILHRHEILERNSEAEETASNNIDELLNPVSTGLAGRSKSENDRVRMINTHHENKKTASRQWRRVLRVLTTERGAWGSPLPEDVLKWKLDNHEDKCRRRRRLKRNFAFSDHNEATRVGKDEKPKPVESSQPVLPKAAVLYDTYDEAEETAHQEEPEDWDVLDPSVVVAGKSAENGNHRASEEKTKKEEETKEKVVFARTYCEIITPLTVAPGWLEITNKNVNFYSKQSGDDLSAHGEEESLALLATAAASAWERTHKATGSGSGDKDSKMKDRKWGLEEITQIHPRRYLLRPSAIEIFLVDGNNYFLNFSKKNRDRIFDKIISLDCPNMVQFSKTRNPLKWYKQSGLAQRWQRREISNFEYLIQLNSIAGRTYNDLNQYPVFPWILTDYESSSIDLSDEKVFRDLSKPIGALEEKRLAECLERYAIWDDPVIPKFMYGSHYSSAGIVLYYQIRIEPFTSLFLKLQGGKFDYPDRMFDSIAGTWKNCLQGTGDVRELIPELFYMPEMLVNSNHFNLGTKQTGEKIDNVVMPPWANGSPETFIQIHSDALESEYVSEHLNEWIDLVFGYKQRGVNAIEANNVFYHLTYEGSVDIDKIEDVELKNATISQIDNFGQTPTQLVRKHPHPKRRSVYDCTPMSPVIFSHPQALRAYFLQLPPSSPLVYIGLPPPAPSSLLYIGVPDRVVTVDRNRILAAHRWLPNTPNAQGSPFTFEFDPSLTTRHGIGVSYARGISPGPHCMAISRDGKTLFSCGYWDNTFKVHLVESSRMSQSIRAHKDVVTCLAMSADGHTLVTGSRDTTCMIWDVSFASGVARVSQVPRAVLYGHDDEVSCVSLNSEHDMVASVSKDGTCVLHSLRHVRYIRTIRHSESGAAFNLCSFTPDSHIVMYSEKDLSLHMYSCNGKKLHQADTNGHVSSLWCSDRYFVTGDDHGLVVSWRSSDLTVAHKYNVQHPIHCVVISPSGNHILAGTFGGKLLVFAIDPNNKSAVS